MLSLRPAREGRADSGSAAGAVAAADHTVHITATVTALGALSRDLSQRIALSSILADQLPLQSRQLSLLRPGSLGGEQDSLAVLEISPTIPGERLSGPSWYLLESSERV